MLATVAGKGVSIVAFYVATLMNESDVMATYFVQANTKRDAAEHVASMLEYECTHRFLNTYRLIRPNGSHFQLNVTEERMEYAL